MGTTCEFCGSKRHQCYSLNSYGGCGEARRLAEADYWSDSEDQPHVSHWDEAVDKELEFYPDDDFPEADAKVNYFPSVPDQVAIIPDDINTPGHYANYAIEPITFIMRNKLPFAEGNAIKYIMRHTMKNGIEDLRKARKYLEFIARDTYGEGL